MLPLLKAKNCAEKNDVQVVSAALNIITFVGKLHRSIKRPRWKQLTIPFYPGVSYGLGYIYLSFIGHSYFVVLFPIADG